MGTTRRRENADETHLYLDLSGEIENWQCPWPVSVAVVCAGATKIEACRRDPVATARVNVQGTVALVKKLVESGTFVIYLSTNQVFDGSVPQRSPDDPRSPITEYGKQKAEAERQVSQWDERVAIVRLTKVFGPRVPLFEEWVRALRTGETIQPFWDMSLAPIPLSCVVSILRLLCDLRLPGILQVSGERDISYAEAARIGAELIGADLHLVQPIEGASRYPEPIPRYTSLNTERLKSALGIEPPRVGWTVETAFVKSQALGGLC